MAVLAVFRKQLDQSVIISRKLSVFPDQGSPVLALAPVLCLAQSILGLKLRLPLLLYIIYLLPANTRVLTSTFCIRSRAGHCMDFDAMMH